VVFRGAHKIVELNSVVVMMMTLVEDITQLQLKTMFIMGDKLSFHAIFDLELHMPCHCELEERSSLMNSLDCFVAKAPRNDV